MQITFYEHIIFYHNEFKKFIISADGLNVKLWKKWEVSVTVLINTRSSDTLTPVLYISKSINLSCAPINVFVSQTWIKALNSSFVIKLITDNSCFLAGNIKARLLIALYSGAVSVTYCINDFIAAIRLLIDKTKAVLIFKIIF